MFTAILWPVFALVALTYAVWFTLYVQRFAHMRNSPPTKESFATGEAAKRYFQPVEMGANNLANLFEMPMLFLTIVPLLLIMGQDTTIQVILAWAFVAFRAGHSVVHVRRGPVAVRFSLYLISCGIGLAMWIGFGVDLLLATYLR